MKGLCLQMILHLFGCSRRFLFGRNKKAAHLGGRWSKVPAKDIELQSPLRKANWAPLKSLEVVRKTRCYAARKCHTLLSLLEMKTLRTEYRKDFAKQVTNVPPLTQVASPNY